MLHFTNVNIHMGIVQNDFVYLFHETVNSSWINDVTMTHVFYSAYVEQRVFLDPIYISWVGVVLRIRP